MKIFELDQVYTTFTCRHAGLLWEKLYKHQERAIRMIKLPVRFSSFTDFFSFIHYTSTALGVRKLRSIRDRSSLHKHYESADWSRNWNAHSWLMRSRHFFFTFFPSILTNFSFFFLFFNFIFINPYIYNLLNLDFYVMRQSVFSSIF